jgi:hypothetical protein
MLVEAYRSNDLPQFKTPQLPAFRTMANSRIDAGNQYQRIKTDSDHIDA